LWRPSTQLIRKSFVVCGQTSGRPRGIGLMNKLYYTLVYTPYIVFPLVNLLVINIIAFLS